MDTIVRQAMAKWPNVPACYGWLGLDARGHWYLRDDEVQAKGNFAQSKGSWLRHEKLLAFIGRNYQADACGLWYFQNGPQRVYVELECAPWVWRLLPDLQLQSQIGSHLLGTKCVLDTEGRVYLETAAGLGLVHSLDTGLVVDALERGAWEVEEVPTESLPDRYGFVLSPEQAQRR